MRGGELDGEQVLLSRCAADDERDVIRRASSCTERFHLLHQEGDKCALVLDASLGLLVEIGLVGRTATLGHAQEVILHAMCGLQIDLRGQVALGVHLVEHVQRGVLRVAQVALGVGVEHTAAECLLILKSCPDLLAFLAVDDSCAGVLAERQLAFGGNLGVTKEG